MRETRCGAFRFCNRGFSCTRGSYGARKMTTQCGAFRVHNVNFRARDARKMTTQCGAFRVRNVNFCARDTRTTLALTTDQCGARSGSELSSTFAFNCTYAHKCVLIAHKIAGAE